MRLREEGEIKLTARVHCISFFKNVFLKFKFN